MNKDNVSPHFPASPSLSFYYKLTAANRLDISLEYTQKKKKKQACGTNILVQTYTWTYIQCFILVMSQISSLYSGIINI